MIHTLDDHYNQDRFRYEGNGCVVIRYDKLRLTKFEFNRNAKPLFFFNTQLGHRDNYFKEKKSV